MSRQTPKHRHEPIPMTRLPGDRIEGDRPELGQFAWSYREGKRVLHLVIPCPGRTNGIWSEWTIGHRNGCGAQWSWDGNEDLPTLSPSLHAVGVWHGYVRKGKLVEA